MKTTAWKQISLTTLHLHIRHFLPNKLGKANLSGQLYWVTSVQAKIDNSPKSILKDVHFNLSSVLFHGTAVFELKNNDISLFSTSLFLFALKSVPSVRAKTSETLGFVFGSKGNVLKCYKLIFKERLANYPRIYTLQCYRAAKFSYREKKNILPYRKTALT